MEALLLALIASMVWGTSDFLGGFQNRSIPILTVLLVSFIAGLATISVVVYIQDQSLSIDRNFLGFSLAAGITSVIALGCLYRAMAVGPIFIVAPIAAVGTILPVIFGFSQGDQPTQLQYLGIIIALIAVVMVSYEKGGDDKDKKLVSGAGYAIAAAVSIGCFFITFDIATDHNPWWGTLFTQIFGTLLIMIVIMVTRTPVRCQPRQLPALILIGVLDIVAETLYAVASTMGMLSTVTVVASMWPATTVLLGFVVLREPLRLGQRVGVIGSLIGIGLISSV